MTEIVDERQRLVAALVPDTLDPAIFGDLTQHSRSCDAGYNLDSNGCTCGLIYRQHWATAETMSAAWRKRAMEAESALASRPQPRKATGEGWAVAQDGRINVASVSLTRRAATINWLVVEKRCAILDTHTDEWIETLWRSLQGAAEAVRVTISAAAPPSPAAQEQEK